MGLHEPTCDRRGTAVPTIASAEQSDRFPAGMRGMLDRYARPARPGALIAEGAETGAVLFVLRGWLARSKALEDGGVQIIDFALPGDGLAPAGCDGITADATVDVLTPALVATVPTGLWARAQFESPGLATWAGAQAAAAMARIGARMLRMGKSRAETRLAHALLELFLRSAGSARPRERRFHLPLKQEHLGNFTGMSAVHVSRTTARLTAAGLIRMTGHLTFELRDMDGLQSMAGTDLDGLRAAILPEPAGPPLRRCG